MKLWIGEWSNPFIVSWQYTPMKQGRVMTTCYIRAKGVKDDNDATQDTEWFGNAFQNKGDKFDKEVGRKLALKRALEQSPFTRAERQQVWKAYFLRGAQDLGDGEWLMVL